MRSASRRRMRTQAEWKVEALTSPPTVSPSIALRRSLSSPAALFVKVMASTFPRARRFDPQQAQLVQRGGAAAAHRRFEVVDVLLRGRRG